MVTGMIALTLGLTLSYIAALVAHRQTNRGDNIERYLDKETVTVLLHAAGVI